MLFKALKSIKKPQPIAPPKLENVKIEEYLDKNKTLEDLIVNNWLNSRNQTTL